MKKKPIVKEIPAPSPAWENDTHTIERLEGILKLPRTLAKLSPGEIYALRRAIRLIKAR